MNVSFLQHQIKFQKIGTWPMFGVVLPWPHLDPPPEVVKFRFVNAANLLFSVHV